MSKLDEVYQDIVNPNHIKAHVRVPCSLTEITHGMTPHVQPEILLEYHSRTPIMTTGSMLDPLPSTPPIHVHFELRDFDTSKLVQTRGKEAPAVGTLQTNCITKMHAEIGKDRVTDAREDVFEPVQPGQLPHYAALKYVAATREMAINAFQAAEARSSSRAVTSANEALSENTVSLHDKQNTLRAAYSADLYPGPHTFQPEHLSDMYRMRGFTYANPLGMDVPMRAMQSSMQLMVATLNFDSMAHIKVFFDAMSQHTELQNYDGSPEADAQLHDALRGAMTEFAMHIPQIAMQARVGAVVDTIPQLINKAKEAAKEPVAQQLNALMQGKETYGTFDPMATQLNVYSRFTHMLKQQLSAGDTLGAAEQHAVQRATYENAHRGDISDIIPAGNETPGNDERNDPGDDTVGNDTI